MYVLTFDKELSLYWPLAVPPEHGLRPRGYIYFSTVDSKGLDLPVCISIPVTKEENRQLYPNGTRARVVSSVVKAFRTHLLVAASTITPLECPPTPLPYTLSDKRSSGLLWPSLLLSGSVSDGILAKIQPELVLRSVVLGAAEEDAGAARVTCTFDANGTDEEILLVGVVDEVSPTSMTIQVWDARRSSAPDFCHL
ncbi:hypothetical protein AURDEDRAFT_171295 [Auricularia subglabra TFB-10046 SS5]|nr:hypothetical protein AURDEDRAFT_171295 [Auricularia subglabra TFB-10046 SS5]